MTPPNHKGATEPVPSYVDDRIEVVKSGPRGEGFKVIAGEAEFVWATDDREADIHNARTAQKVADAAAKAQAQQTWKEALRGIEPQFCRGLLKDEFCRKPAEFIVWGKLFPKDAVGPRCYDCAAAKTGHDALKRISGYAVYRLPALLQAAAPNNQQGGNR